MIPLTGRILFARRFGRYRHGLIVLVLGLGLAGTGGLSDARAAGTATATPTPAATPSGCATGVKLVLVPGQHWPGSHSLPIPRDLPPGNVTVHLPVYPGAQTTTVKQAHPAISYEANSYMKSASIEYETPDALGTVMDWYRTAIAACGYTFKAAGEFSLHGTVVSHEIDWVKPRGRGQFWMALSFASTAAGGTSILYAAIVYTPPVYPTAGSILRVPDAPVSLTITQYSGFSSLGPSRPLRVVTMTGKTVRSLADEINHLPKLTGGVMSCPADDGSHLTLVFADSDGSHHVVTVNEEGCRTVSAPPAPAGWLYDDPRLLPRLLALVQGPGSGPVGFFDDARTLRPVRVRLLAGTDGRFLSTGQNGRHILYLAHGNLYMGPASGNRRRLLARNIADASFGIDDFVALARPLHSQQPNIFTVIDTRNGRRRPLALPPGVTFLGQNAGLGPADLRDALEYDLQLVWYRQGRRLGGIDPEHPNTDTFTSAPFLPVGTRGELIALTSGGNSVAVFLPRTGITIFGVPFEQGTRGRVSRRLPASGVTFLSWAPDGIHLAYRAGNNLYVADVNTGAVRHLLSLRGQTVHGVAWDPWSHVLALSLTTGSEPAWQSYVELVNADGTGARRLPLAFTGAGDLRWSTFQGRTIGVTRVTPHGTQAWAITLAPIPKDPGQP